jgi:hypothetical protein
VNIIFSDHALLQIKRRNIPKKIVIQGVEKSTDINQSFRGRTVRRIRHEDKMLEIVTLEQNLEVTIITAYYLEIKDLI